MLVFIVRRLFVSIWVFFTATIVIFFLATKVKDPLATHASCRTTRARARWP